mgnify:CR=1 FL=1
MVEATVISFTFEEDVAGAAFPVFGDVDVEPGPVGDAVFVWAGEEHDDVGVLLDVAGFAEVAEVELASVGLFCLSAEQGDFAHR